MTILYLSRLAPASLQFITYRIGTLTPIPERIAALRTGQYS